MSNDFLQFSVKGEATTVLREMAKSMPRAAARAVNKTAKPTGIKRIADSVGESITLKKSAIKKDVTLAKRATRDDLTARVEVRETRKPGVHQFTRGYRPRDTRKTTFDPQGQGVLFRLRQGGKLERSPRAFIASVHGLRLVMSRFGRDGELHRGPRGGVLRVLTGPSTAGVAAGKPGLADEAAGDLGDVLLKRAEEAANFEVLKAMRKR